MSDMTPEQRAAWKARTFHEHYGRGTIPGEPTEAEAPKLSEYPKWKAFLRDVELLEDGDE
jgi:hypothetical protein